LQANVQRLSDKCYWKQRSDHRNMFNKELARRFEKALAAKLLFAPKGPNDDR